MIPQVEKIEDRGVAAIINRRFYALISFAYTVEEYESAIKLREKLVALYED